MLGYFCVGKNNFVLEDSSTETLKLSLLDFRDEIENGLKATSRLIVCHILHT